MDTSDVTGFLKKALPWIGAAATGNVPLLVSMAGSAVSEALGTKVEATPSAIAQAIAGATPEDLLKLKQAENDFAAKMAELNYKEHTELYAQEVADRNGARDREVKTGDNTNRILAFFITLVWAALNTLVFTHSVPSGSEQLVARLLGTLDAALMAVLYYYFGSSHSSQSKTDALNAIATKGSQVPT